MRAAVGAAPLVAAAEGRRRRPGGLDELLDGQAGVRDGLLGGGDVRLGRASVVGRDRVLPEQLLPRDLGADVSRARSHVAVGEFEPGAGEGVRELVGFSMKRREIFSYSGSMRIAMSAAVIIGDWVSSPVVASGTVLSPAPPLGFHWLAPAGSW